MIVCNTHFDFHGVRLFIVDEKYYEQGKGTSEQEQQHTDSNFHH